MAKKAEKKVKKKETAPKRVPKKTEERPTDKRGVVPVIKSGGSRRCFFCKANRKIVSKRYYNVGGGAQQKIIYQLECSHFDHD